MYRLQNPFLFTGKLVVSMRLEDNHGRTIFEKEQDVAPFAGEPNAAFASSMGIALEESIDHILGKFRPTNSNPPRHVAGDNATHAPSNPLHKIEPTTTTTTTLGKRRHSCDIPLPSIENPDEFQQPKRARTGEVDRAEPLSSGDEGYDHVDHDDHEDHEERRSLGSSSTQNSGHSPSPDFTPDMEAQPSAHFDNADDANNEDHGDHRLRGGTNYSDPDWRPSPDVWATLDMEIQPDADGDNNEEPGGYRHWRSTSTPDPGLTPAPDIGSMFPEPEPQAPEMKAEPSVERGSSRLPSPSCLHRPKSAPPSIQRRPSAPQQSPRRTSLHDDEEDQDQDQDYIPRFFPWQDLCASPEPITEEESQTSAGEED